MMDEYLSKLFELNELRKRFTYDHVAETQLVGRLNELAANFTSEDWDVLEVALRERENEKV